MLIPIEFIANRKVGVTPVQFTLEDLFGINLPCLDPQVWVLNRTPGTSSVIVNVTRNRNFTNQDDADFNGVESLVVGAPFSLSNGSERQVDLGKLLLGAPSLTTTTGATITHDFRFSNSGPAATAMITVLVLGLVESSIAADPNKVINQ